MSDASSASKSPTTPQGPGPTQKGLAASQALRLAWSGAALVLWLSLLGAGWWMASGFGGVAAVAGSDVAMAQQSRLGRAISAKGAMAPHIPKANERQVIWAWIASAQQRDGFYRDVWPILKARCHRCHGSFRRPKGAMPLTRLAHVLPLVRVKASQQRQGWRSLAQRLPLAGGLLVLLGLLLGTGRRVGVGAVIWLTLASVGLLAHGVGAWSQAAASGGGRLTLVGAGLFAVAVTGLTAAMLWRWWRPSSSD